MAVLLRPLAARHCRSVWAEAPRVIFRSTQMSVRVFRNNLKHCISRRQSTILILVGNKTLFIIYHNLGCEYVPKDRVRLKNHASFPQSVSGCCGATAMPSSLIYLSVMPVIRRPEIRGVARIIFELL